MPNLIVRNISQDDVTLLKRAAADVGASLQAFLAEELHNEASRRRRREAVSRMRARMASRSTVSADEIAQSVAAIREERDKPASSTHGTTA